MSISSISSNPLRQQLQQDFQSLAGVLQSGSLSGVQSAFSSLMQLLPNSSSAVNSQTQTTATSSVSSSSNGTSSTITNDLSALGQAIQSGNLTGAQNDFTKLTQDMQSIGGWHHHHHHKTSASSQNATTASATGSTTGTNLVANDLAALGQALQSGDLKNAGSSYSQLTQAISAGSSINIST